MELIKYIAIGIFVMCVVVCVGVLSLVSIAMTLDQYGYIGATAITIATQGTIAGLIIYLGKTNED